MFVGGDKSVSFQFPLSGGFVMGRVPFALSPVSPTVAVWLCPEISPVCQAADPPEEEMT